MKNITVSVDDDLYHRARVRAAERQTTVSALVREYLKHLADRDTGFERLRQEQDELIARVRSDYPGFSAAGRMTRDEVHERRALR